MNFALPPANCFCRREENSTWQHVIKILFPSPAELTSLLPSRAQQSPTGLGLGKVTAWLRLLRCGFCLPISRAPMYSLAQVASIQGLMDEENGRGGHREELTTAETPVFSTFRQMALRVWVPSPQLVEHWWGKKNQINVNAESYRLIGFYMSSQTQQNMRKVAWKSNSH